MMLSCSPETADSECKYLFAREVSAGAYHIKHAPLFIWTRWLPDPDTCQDWLHKYTQEPVLLLLYAFQIDSWGVFLF